MHLNVAACYQKLGECRKSIEWCNKVFFYYYLNTNCLICYFIRYFSIQWWITLIYVIGFGWKSSTCKGIVQERHGSYASWWFWRSKTRFWDGWFEHYLFCSFQFLMSRLLKFFHKNLIYELQFDVFRWSNLTSRRSLMQQLPLLSSS